MTCSLREIETDEVGLLASLLDTLEEHHNAVDAYFPGSHHRPRSEALDEIGGDMASGKSHVAVMEDEGVICGFCKIDVVEDTGYVEYLIVDAAYRGQGWGDALMKWALDCFERAGVCESKLLVVYGNDAIGFYERFGYRPALIEMVRVERS